MNKMKKIMIPVASIFLITNAEQALASVNSAPQEAVQSMIVGYKNVQGKNDALSLNKGTSKDLSLESAVSVDLTASDIALLKSDPNVSYVVTNDTIHLQDSGDTFKAQGMTEGTFWDNEAENIVQAHNDGWTGKGVKVAVLDSGIAAHPDLNIAGGVSEVSYTTSYDDDNGHGTHVAGTIAALNNGFGVLGVAPDVELYAVKVMDSTATGNAVDTISGINWAIANQMDIINLSLGSPVPNPAVKTAIQNAINAGIVVVVSAGNSGTADLTADNITYPAKYSSSMDIVSVGAVDQNLSHASFSSTGSELTFSAPGVSIISTYLNGGYAQDQGTSMAAPHITGMFALLKQEYPSHSVHQLIEDMKAETENLGDSNLYGLGIPIYGYTPPVQADTTAPAEVSNLSVTSKTEDSITLTWSNPADSDFANALISVNGSQVGTSATGSYTITGLNADTNYTITVKTTDVSGNVSGGVDLTVKTEAIPSQPADATPPANVTDLHTTSVDTNSATIAWTNPSDADFDHAVIRVNGVEVGNSATGNYTVSNLNPDTDYEITVTSVDASGNESAGTTINVKTNKSVVTPPVDRTAPGEVSNVQATPDTHDAWLTWNNPSDIDFAGVNIYDGNKLVGSTSDVEYQVTGLTPNTHYSLILKTVDASGNESIGETISFTTNSVVVVDTTPPSEVSGLQMDSATTDSTVISWVNPTDADFSHVVIQVNGVDDGVTTTSPYSLNNLTPNTQYLVTVKTVDTSGNISSGKTITVKTSNVADTTPPGEVSNVSIDATTENSVSLSWTNPTDADFFVVKVLVDGVTKTTTSSGRVSINNLSSDTDYTITLKTVDHSVNQSAGTTITVHTSSAPVTPDTTAPAEVQGLKVSDTSTNTLSIAWTNPSDLDFDHAVIQVNGVDVGVSTTGSYTINNLDPDTNYLITVKTVDAVGNVSSGASIQQKTDAETTTPSDTTAPAEVSDLRVTDVTDNSITIAFTNPTDADFDHTVIQVNGVEVGTSVASSYTLHNLNPNTNYRITVKTVDAAGNVSTGAVIEQLTDIVPPPVDTTAPDEVANVVVASKGEDFIELTFDNPADADFMLAKIFVDGNMRTSTRDGHIVLQNLNANTLYTIKIVTVDQDWNQSVGTTIQVRTDASAPPVVSKEVSNLTVLSKGKDFVDLYWANPVDPNFMSAKVIVDGTVKGSTNEGHMTISGLNPDTLYNIKVATLDNNGNESDGVTIQVHTDQATPVVVDTTAPDEVSSLMVSAKTQTTLSISFINPADQDFAKAWIYLNGNKLAETASSTMKITNLLPNTLYTITVKTVDTTGNVSAGVTIQGKTDAIPYVYEPPVTTPIDNNVPTEPVTDNDVNTPSEPTNTVVLKDVTHHWSKDTVSWAVSKGIVTGFQDGTFHPDAKVTEAEFYAMIVRYFDPSIQSNTSGNWSNNFYDFAKKHSLPALGLSNVKKRNAVITRQFVAEIICATQGFNLKGDKAIQYLLDVGLAKGSDPNHSTVQSFKGNQTLTRAEAVQFIKNMFDHGLTTIS